MRRKELFSLGILLGVGLLLYVGGSKILGLPLFKSRSNVAFVKPVVTDRANMELPKFTILLPDSVTYIDIGAVPSGKATVLFYFSPYCPYCQAEIKEITSNINLLKEIQFYIITPFSFGEMKAFYKEFQLDKYPNIKMGVDVNFFFGSYFKTGSVPFLAVYGKKNRLNGAFAGNISSEQLLAYANE